MKPNFWQKTFGASRRAKDRALLAALEKEIADEEKLRANPAYLAGIRKMPAHQITEEQRQRIAAIYLASTRKMSAAKADAMPVHHFPEEQRKRIAAAFGRPA